MLKAEAQDLADSLNGLAEAYDKRPITPKAFEIWFETLREFPGERVMAMLRDWPKRFPKFPTPAEAWKAINDEMIGERERKAQEERQKPMPAIRTEVGKQLAQAVKTASMKPRLSPKEHWANVLATAEPGSFQHRTATEALANLERARRKPQSDPVPEREPGEDEAAA